MNDSNIAIIPDIIELLLLIDSKKLDEYRDSKRMIIDVSTFIEKLRKSKHSKDSIFEYIFYLGMMAKENIDETMVKLSKIDIAHNDSLIIQWNIHLA